ncbi:MAG TPA: indole-3-glycerol phosphate synthase TrpC [Thermoanaerobaculaceae bacterium]|nr:indole-3-glycerol phosphate synthase TrpC [Thermoanaerobaculaceae bacterium]
MNRAEPDILARITAAVKERLAVNPAPPDLETRAREAAAARSGGEKRSLVAALRKPGVRVIAECKRRSPSRGFLREPFDPVGLARAYEAGGAAALSAVTEPEFFGGDPGWVPFVRREVSLPVVQKDFLLTPRQVFEASLLGADAVLLIARTLPGSLLSEMLALVGELEMEALVEAHDAADLERVLELPAPLVGINARDLRTFGVDLEGAAQLASRVPQDREVVVESGIAGPADVAALVRRGVRCFLVGEHLLRSRDPGAALAELLA